MYIWERDPQQGEQQERSREGRGRGGGRMLRNREEAVGGAERAGQGGLAGHWGAAGMRWLASRASWEGRGDRTPGCSVQTRTKGATVDTKPPVRGYCRK